MLGVQNAATAEERHDKDLICSAGKSDSWHDNVFTRLAKVLSLQKSSQDHSGREWERRSKANKETHPDKHKERSPHR